MQRLLMTLILLFAVSGWAGANTVVFNMPLNHSLYVKYRPKLVVVGHITGIDNGAPPPVAVDGPPHSNIQFQVASVVQGEAKYQGRVLTVPVNYFGWPQELLPFAVGSRCALVLGENMGESNNEFYLYSVAPVIHQMLPTAHDNTGAIRVLEGELVAVLKAEREPKRQQAILRELAPILTKAHAKAVVPFARSKDKTVARAALSALIYATEDSGYIRIGAQDAQNFFAGLKPDAIADAKRDLFLDYFFLDSESWRWGHRWDEAEADKHLRIVKAFIASGLLSARVEIEIKPTEENAVH